MVVEGNELVAMDRPVEKQLSLPINLFFRSLAASRGDRGAAIVLSGTGSDGSGGILDVHEAGGLVLVQSAQSATFDGMPRSAHDTGCADAVLSPEEMPAALKAYVDNRYVGADMMPGRADDHPPDGIPSILHSLRSVYDIDFNYYKPGTITRRIERRVAMHPQHISVEE